MEHYYVNKNAQPTGEHELHKSGCSYMPDSENKLPLGKFNNCKEAIKEAKKFTQMSTDVFIAAMSVIRDKKIISFLF